MNDAGAPSWSGAEPFDPMGAEAESDFSNLMNFDNLDLDFSLDYTNGGPEHHDASQELADSLDLQHLRNHYTPPIAHEHGDGGQQQQNALGGGAPNGFFEFNRMSPYGQPNPSAFSAPPDQIYRAHAGVPPTPNSVEMHGDPARYLQQQMDSQQALFDQRYHHKDDASFTPLVSPAVTPHDARFQVPDFTVPGAYFSPLTSPALQAMNSQGHHHSQAHVHYNTTSGSSAGASPIDVDMDALGEAAVTPQEQGRRLRSNRSRVPRSSNATGRVRQSPIVKPGRRKPTVSSLIPPKEVSELVEEAQRSRSARPSSSGLGVPHSRETSETESISPEPLSDMGPPPKPGSVVNSPAIPAQARQSMAGVNGVAPATPASLMRIQQSPNFGIPHGVPEVPPMLDDFALPEASLDKPALSRLNTTIQISGDQSTPRMTARKTPKLDALSTPTGVEAMSGKPSPMLSAISSPTSPGFALGAGRRMLPKGARTSKKRDSISTILVSPALRPKISPSIKPLLPEGATGLSDDTHALLLASKSNYQNIIDGTTVPGVVYPTSLSTNLTSKRTSHKIAEQGRRNRINTALLELQALLPSPQISAKDAVAKSPDSASAAAQSSNSKAAKVESAIDYIRQLKKEGSDKDRLLDQKDAEMEALRKELAALRRGSSAGSSDIAGDSDPQMKPEALSSSEGETAV
ncbi:hypothetical protein P154DRAFT_333683 [Amniculicola lignicola CBS 123094]|uniref:BHLH domain-containing protein n=1 Tax=Amniculicola lignicola CBS 123094 TaxID=1392246 RepID=A0A6A5W3P2_9PLEO|nr:hypothetical protein P154DRAFT_333683 [Amniculicola lignicola CBS 123094]